MWNVTTLRETFYGASAFNQPIGDWKTGKVISLMSTFNSASSFNQPIGDWNVSEVRNRLGTFKNATLFNQPIANWDVSRVNNLTKYLTEPVHLTIQLGIESLKHREHDHV